MRRTCIILIIGVIATLFSCNSENFQSSYSRDKVKSVISNHEKTMIFIWSDWCGASQRNFEKNIKPYLGKLEKNDVGIVLIHYGNDVMDSLSFDRLVLNIKPHGGIIDRIDANFKMKRLLKNYRKCNFFPIPLLVDKNGNILNFCDGHIFYDSYKIKEAAMQID